MSKIVELYDSYVNASPFRNLAFTGLLYLMLMLPLPAALFWFVWVAYFVSAFMLGASIGRRLYRRRQANRPYVGLTFDERQRFADMEWDAQWTPSADGIARWDTNFYENNNTKENK